VAYEVRGEASFVWVPAVRLQQVLENLLDNAVDFSPVDAMVSIVVESRGATVILRVCDNGPGIPPEHRERIFDRFFTFRPGVEKGVHAGLGLAIVKAIAESHAGHVRVSNRPSGGACFEVELPAAPPALREGQS
jgi:two-component system sensor histidine kinase ChvG